MAEMPAAMIQDWLSPHGAQLARATRQDERRTVVDMNMRAWAALILAAVPCIIAAAEQTSLSGTLHRAEGADSVADSALMTPRRHVPECFASDLQTKRPWEARAEIGGMTSGPQDRCQECGGHWSSGRFVVVGLIATGIPSESGPSHSTPASVEVERVFKSRAQ